MNVIFSFFRLIRISNILIMLITVCLAYYCLNDYIIPEDMLESNFIFLVLSVLFTASAGYIINDYYDIKLDLINKPSKVIIGNEISRRVAMLLHTSFNLIAFVLAAFINFKVAIAIIFCSVLLYLYSVYFKKQFLSGNIIISFLSGFMIIILWLFNKSLPLIFAFSYASFSFVITLIREIIKDAEDMKGDSRFDCKTIPIVLGIRRTNKVLINISAVFILLLFAYIFLLSDEDLIRNNARKYLYIFYLIITVVLPLITLIILISKADTKKDYSRLSTLVKIIMLTGIFSMILLKI